MRALLLALVIFVAARTVWAQEGMPSCAGTFDRVYVVYDPVTDSTTAMAALSFQHPPSIFATQYRYQILVNVRFQGVRTDSALVPRIYVESQDPNFMLAHSFPLALLVDDSLRYSWQPRNSHTRTSSDMFFGSQVHFQRSYRAAADEFARLANASTATIVLGDVRKTVRKKDLRDLAELSRWMSCPDRPAAKPRK